MPVSKTDIVVQSPDCLTADVNDEAVIMDIESGQYISLDPVSKDIWGLIVQPSSVDDLCASLAAVYDAPMADIETDVIVFIDFMLATKVVRLVN